MGNRSASMRFFVAAFVCICAIVAKENQVELGDGLQYGADGSTSAGIPEGSEVPVDQACVKSKGCFMCPQGCCCGGGGGGLFPAPGGSGRLGEPGVKALHKLSATQKTARHHAKKGAEESRVQQLANEFSAEGR